MGEDLLKINQLLGKQIEDLTKELNIANEQKDIAIEGLTAIDECSETTIARKTLDLIKECEG